MIKTIAFAGMLVSLMFLQSNAFAMFCGPHLIEGDQDQGMSMKEVKKLCGEPAEVRNYGDDLVYKQEGGATYILHFNTDGILESISQE
jgi:hypothetical protein